MNEGASVGWCGLSISRRHICEHLMESREIFTVAVDGVYHKKRDRTENKGAYHFHARLKGG